MNKTPMKTFGPYGSGQGSFIEVAVWENEVDVEGGRKATVHAISFSRNYREKEEWKKTKTLRLQDIPVLQFALGKAQEFLLETKSS